ncbi:hypothetical protein QA601_17880 [Chitinispirillales bacterium ANBcel5]|uniref:hypothetical protein n=1 Tax=Cellulosispirillum alkaliphilum TaxID=3039283 RepID=UPI002A5790AF|nr:hypothetical protein [Chitinispirillales bacterium ANBcel5]
MINRVTIFLFPILLFQVQLLAFSRAPSPTYFITCPNIADSCFYQRNSRNHRPVPITEINKAVESPHYKYSIVHSLAGTTKRVKIEKWEKDNIITRSDTINLHRIRVVDSYIGPRFSNDDILYQLVWPLVWAGIFGAIEGLNRENEKYNWKAPLYAFGISFGLVFPFTFRLNKQSIEIAY